ncbi:hypothetical protein B0H11DRAFT_2290690 [Mycena galericulata]|nr:hypothetical protein B0H11DRAFT_2290690 [Mycena galericulata]
MYPYFTNDTFVLEYDLVRSDWINLHRESACQWAPPPKAVSPPVPVECAKSRSVSPARSSIKSERTSEKPSPGPTQIAQFESALNVLESLFQGVYASTLSRLMLE